MKNKVLYGVVIMSVAMLIAFNIVTVKKSNNNSNIALFDVEALADVEWNHWTQWWGQGFTKDEREYERPCPSDESSSGSGNVSHGNTSIGGGGSHSQTNPSGRNEITCPYGSDNCTPIDC